MKILDSYRIEMLENLLNLNGYIKTLYGELSKQTLSNDNKFNLVEIVSIEEGKINYKSYLHDMNFEVSNLVKECFLFTDYTEACNIIKNKISI